MPILIGENIAVSHDNKESYRHHPSKKQSRLTVYLTSLKEKEKENVSIFSETSVQNLLEEHKERKKTVRKFEKLKLVWKGTYNPEQTPQDALNKLLDQRKQTFKVRIDVQNTRIIGAKKISRLNSKAQDRAMLTSSNVVQYENKSSVTEQVVHGPYQRVSFQNYSTKTDESHAVRSHAVTSSQSDNLGSLSTSKYEDETSSVRLQPNLQHCYSRNIFNSKKATGHQEHNLFLYQAEKKRQTNRKEANEKNRKYNDSDALKKAIQLERKKLLPELKNKVDVDTLLRAYLSEQFLDLYLQGEEAEGLRHMYASAILHQPAINNFIMKHPDMLPSRIFKDLVTFKKGFEVNPIYSPTVVKAEKSAWRDIYKKTLSSPSGNILIELEADMPQYANFYKILIEKRNKNLNIDNSWIKERSSTTITEHLIHLAVNLRIGRQNPGSTVRFDVLKMFSAAEHNDRLLKQLALSVDGWLDQLVKGLTSPFKSVREETCQVLCFMTSCYPVMRELYLSRYFDVVQDLCLAILRAFDHFEDTFPEYYMLLAHIIHYCPSRSILECIIERWTHFRCVGLILQWPRLLYYALRYWPDDALYLVSHYFSTRLTKALEAAFQRPLTAKKSRCALYYLQVRFNNVSHLFTVNYDKGTTLKTVLEAITGK